MSARAGFLAAVLLALTTAQADDRLFLTGGELADTAYYAYTGVVLPLGEPREGRRFIQRYWLDALGYEYDGGPGRVEADAWGAEAALGYVLWSPDGWAEISAGLRYTDTDLEPDDPGAGARGSEAGVRLGVQGERHLGNHWKAGAIVSWANHQDAWWSRARLMRELPKGYSVGAEFVAGGNDESRSTAAGLVVGFRLSNSLNLALKSGYRWQDESDSVYGGFELGYAF